jgi:hypothetical protein
VDTVFDEPEQGVTLAADLLQDTHAEVVGSKPSIVPSDEERLAAGISTIRPQTNRLSGAQWKKLIKARKMKEGTWTVEKPPRLIHLRRRWWGKVVGA